MQQSAMTSRTDVLLSGKQWDRDVFCFTITERIHVHQIAQSQLQTTRIGKEFLCAVQDFLSNAEIAVRPLQRNHHFFFPLHVDGMGRKKKRESKPFWWDLTISHLSMWFYEIIIFPFRIPFFIWSNWSCVPQLVLWAREGFRRRNHLDTAPGRSWKKFYIYIMYKCILSFSWRYFTCGNARSARSHTH